MALQQEYIKAVSRTFLLGYCTKAGLSCGAALLSGKLFKSGVLRKLLFGGDAISFGKFVACLSGLYKATIYILRRVRKQDSLLHSGIAGFIAGHAVMLDDPSRRGTLALYVIVRAVANVLRLLVYYKKVKPIKHLPIYLFALIHAPIMFMFCHYPECLDTNYANKLHWLGNKTAEAAQKAFCSQISGPYRQESERFAECVDSFHPDDNICSRHHLRSFGTCFIRGVQLYIPLHFLPPILMNPRQVVTEPIKHLKRALIGTLWSSLFVSSFSVTSQYVTCTIRNIIRDDPWWIGAVAGIVAGSTLVLERQERRPELILFLLPKVIRALYKFYHNQTKFLEKIPNGQTLLFSSGVAMFMICYSINSNAMKGLDVSVLRMIFGEPN